MTILIFNWRDPKHSWSGGGEIYIFEQAKRWVKMGYEVKVFCASQDVGKTLPSFEEINGIKIHRKGGRYTLYLWAVLYYFKHLRKNVDVVIDVENGIPFFTPLFCRIPKVCVVYHVHAKQFFYELPAPISQIGYIVEKYIFPLLYKKTPIIAISQTTKNQLIDIGFKNDKIEVVYCGMKESRGSMKGSIKKSLQPTFLYLGRIRKYKRVDLLINIFPKIVEKIPQVRLIIAGWGTEGSYVTDLVMRSPLRRKITVVGPVTDMEKKILLSKCWLFVNPSIGEGWGIGVIEANLYGTPAIAFNVPGLSESIQDGKTGLLAKSEDDLVDKICAILGDKNLQERLSENATVLANSFSWDVTAKKTISLLEKIRRTN